MNYMRNWRGSINPVNDLEAIHLLEWQPITVKRAVFNSSNVGVDRELDDETLIFEIKAKLTEIAEKEKTFIAVVEKHIVPMLARDDVWIDGNLRSYLVKNIENEVIYLDEV